MEEQLAREIGDRIAKWRRAKHMTQEALAEMINVTPAFISRVECGKKKMKISTLIATAKALDVSCDDLLLPDDASAMADIQHLLKGKPSSYLRGIAAIIRACNDNFEAME